MLVRQHLVKIGRDAAPSGAQASGADATFLDTKAALPLKSNGDGASTLKEFGVSTHHARTLICRGELSRGRCHYWLGLRIATRRRCGDDLGVPFARRFRTRRDHLYSRRGMPCHKRRPGRTAGIDGRSKKGSLPPEQGLAFGHSGSETSDGGRWNSEFQRA